MDLPGPSPGLLLKYEVLTEGLDEVLCNLVGSKVGLGTGAPANNTVSGL